MRSATAQLTAANSATKWQNFWRLGLSYRCLHRGIRLDAIFSIYLRIFASTSKRQLVVVLHTRPLALTARSFDMQIPLELPNGGRGLHGRLPMGCSFPDRSTEQRHAPHERREGRREAFHIRASSLPQSRSYTRGTKKHHRGSF